VLEANAVEYIQGMVNQMEPIAKPGYTYKKKYHYQGLAISTGSDI